MSDPFDIEHARALLEPTNTYLAELELYGATRGNPWTDAGELARAALHAVPVRFQGCELYAYAEALLRTGWSP